MFPKVGGPLLLALSLVGCAAASSPPSAPGAVSPEAARPEGPESAATGDEKTALPAAPSQAGARENTAPPPAGSAPPTSPGSSPNPSGSERHGPPLPELKVKSFGLHVGGAARDAAARDVFLRALERDTWRYLECYQLVEAPGSEGTFGADLRVPGSGGKAGVGHVRTKLKGSAFRSCMEQALGSASFEPTPSGRSVVVSYSLKFSFAW